MPLVDITDPRVINFLIENYEKESQLRQKWIHRHEEQLHKAATFSGEPKNYTCDDVNKYLMVAGLATITRDHVEAARHRLIAPAKDYLRAQVSAAKSSEPPMMPVLAKETDILRESRKEYLKTRNKQAPEDKFNFVECDSWKYGWKLAQSKLKMRGPAYGTVCHMMHTLQSRVGAMPDPTYYSSPDATRTFCESL